MASSKILSVLDAVPSAWVYASFAFQGISRRDGPVTENPRRITLPHVIWALISVRLGVERAVKTLEDGGVSTLAWKVDVGEVEGGSECGERK